MIDLLCITQGDLGKLLKDTLNLTITSDKYLIYSKTQVPKPMLCVHLDTINTCSTLVDKTYSPKDFKVDNKGVIRVANKNLQCLGGDDRAGVWIALQMIKHMEKTGNYQYDVGFFYDEEIGCVGSRDYIGRHPDIKTTAYIGLDRRSPQGTQEVALYGSDNETLTRIFTDLGYDIALGSVTDASTLAHSVACVNLSVGYDNEHTRQEVLYLQCMIDTLEVLKILKFDDKPYPIDITSSNYMDTDYALLEEELLSLEEENIVLKDTLRSLGVDVEHLLQSHDTLLVENIRWL